MRTLWKHTIPDVPGTVTIETGAVPVVRSAGVDAEGFPCVWIECDPTGADRVRVYVGWTGRELPWGEDVARFVGTVLAGPLILHVYSIHP